jgi:hypothetical protein
VRIIRRLIVTLAILAGLAALGNVLIVQAAEQKAGDQIRARLHLSASPVVKIEGFPILLHVLKGNIPKVTIDGREIEVEGLHVSSFHVEVRGLRATLSELRAGIGRLHVDGGVADAVVTQDACNDYLQKKHEEGRVTFGDGVTTIMKHTTYLGRRYLVEARGNLTIEGADLVFTATRVTIDGKVPPGPLAARARRDASFKVHLPAIPGGFRPETIVVTAGRARLATAFDASTIDLAKP